MKAVTIKDRGYDDMMRRFAALKQASLVVGIYGKNASASHGNSKLTNGEIAAVHEFGSHDGKVPERSFVRATVDEERTRISRMQSLAATAVVKKNAPIQKALGVLGEFVVGKIKRKIQAHIPPPLSPETIARKTKSAAARAKLHEVPSPAKDASKSTRRKKFKPVVAAGPEEPAIGTGGRKPKAPALAKAPKARKKRRRPLVDNSSTPLIDTGQLINSIAWEVRT